MSTEQQLTDAGWTNVRPAARGGLMGESEAGTGETNATVSHHARP